MISELASPGRSRTQSSVNRSAALAAPMWLAANASVNVRGSRRVHAPGSPMTRSSGTSKPSIRTLWLTVARIPITSHWSISSTSGAFAGTSTQTDRSG